jgi:hypothetical protein
MTRAPRRIRRTRPAPGAGPACRRRCALRGAAGSRRCDHGRQRSKSRYCLSSTANPTKILLGRRFSWFAPPVRRPPLAPLLRGAYCSVATLSRSDDRLPSRAGARPVRPLAGWGVLHVSVTVAVTPRAPQEVGRSSCFARSPMSGRICSPSRVIRATESTAGPGEVVCASKHLGSTGVGEQNGASRPPACASSRARSSQYLAAWKSPDSQSSATHRSSTRTCPSRSLGVAPGRLAADRESKDAMASSHC